MGNYNKWRKILVILMIINMCFVLFARFTRVFGADLSFMPDTFTSLEDKPTDINFTINGANYTFKVPAYIYDYKNVIVYFTQESSGSVLYWNVIFSNADIQVIDTGNWVGWFTGDATSESPIYAKFNSFSYINNLSGQSLSYFTQYTSKPANAINTQTLNTNTSKVLFLKGSITDTSYNLIYTTNVSYPYFDNVTEIENGNPDGVFISPNDYGVDDTLYFHLLEVVYSTPNSNNDTIFYYLPKIFALDKSSPYLKYYLDNEDEPYYFIPRKALGLSADSSYLYVLSNSSESYNNSVGIIEEDTANGVFDVVSSDTTGILSYQETIDDNVDNIGDFLRDNNVGDYNLNYNNENSELTSMNNGFFSRLLSLVSDSFDYELSDDTIITIPMPHSNKTIQLHSNILYNNVNGVIRTIIEAFWFYVFGFYVFRFINKLYIAISSGSILDTFSSSDEAITNNML